MDRILRRQSNTTGTEQAPEMRSKLDQGHAQAVNNLAIISLKSYKDR